MQVFGNVATDPVRKVSKATNKGYYEYRLCENSRAGEKTSSQWYSVRQMKDIDPHLSKGAFVKVTGQLRVDSFHDRTGKPASALLIIAFESVQMKSSDELKKVREANLAVAKVPVAA